MPNELDSPRDKMPFTPAELDTAQAQRLMSQLVDGELSPSNAQRLKRFLEASPKAIDWAEGLELTRSAARQSPSMLDHSVAIYSIQALIDSKDTKNKGKIVRFPAFTRPLAAAAAIAIIGGFAWIGLTPDKASGTLDPAIVEFVATDIPDASTFVYTDEESGWTVVWVEEMDPILEEHG